MPTADSTEWLAAEGGDVGIHQPTWKTFMCNFSIGSGAWLTAEVVAMNSVVRRIVVKSLATACVPAGCCHCYCVFCAGCGIAWFGAAALWSKIGYASTQRPSPVLQPAIF